jgi:hypothetical protein
VGKWRQAAQRLDLAQIVHLHVSHTHVLSSARIAAHVRALLQMQVLHPAFMTCLLSSTVRDASSRTHWHPTVWCKASRGGQRRAWSREPKWFFMHLIATYLLFLMHCALSTSLKVPSPFLATRRYSARSCRL